MKTLSQAGQDVFAAFVNNFKRNGFYVDLGCNEPFTCNNTAMLESDYDWSGILVDYDARLVAMCAQARPLSICECKDLSTTGVEDLLQLHHAPKEIDYLSFDIDYDEPRRKCLQSIDFDQRIIKALTFEHDRYLGGDAVMNESREILQSKGMHLLCANVHFNGWDFEDWYIHKSLLDDRLRTIESVGKDYREIVALCQS